MAWTGATAGTEGGGTGTGTAAGCEGLAGAAGADGVAGLVGTGGGAAGEGPGVTWEGVKGAAGVGAGTIVCAMPGVTITDASMTGSAQPHSIRFIIIKCILDLIPCFIIY